MRLGIQRLAVKHREARALDMRNEITVRALGDHGHLYARLTQRRQGLGQFQFAPSIGPVENLDSP